MKTMLAILLSACAGFDTAQTAVATQGARAADDVRQTAEWTLCDAITVGAWRRAYSADPVKADGWKSLCTSPAGAPR